MNFYIISQSDLCLVLRNQVLVQVQRVGWKDISRMDRELYVRYRTAEQTMCDKSHKAALTSHHSNTVYERLRSPSEVWRYLYSLDTGHEGNTSAIHAIHRYMSIFCGYCVFWKSKVPEVKINPWIVCFPLFEVYCGLIPWPGNTRMPPFFWA